MMGDKMKWITRPVFVFSMALFLYHPSPPYAAESIYGFSSLKKYCKKYTGTDKQISIDYAVAYCTKAKKIKLKCCSNKDLRGWLFDGNKCPKDTVWMEACSANTPVF